MKTSYQSPQDLHSIRVQVETADGRGEVAHRCQDNRLKIAHKFLLDLVADQHLKLRDGIHPSSSC